MSSAWAARLLKHDLVQPDTRSCGAASLVVAHAVRDQAYAEFLLTGTHPTTGWSAPGAVLDRFRDETLAMHRRVTGPADLAGRLQLPWPRLLGTPPWAVAHQLSTRATPYVVRQALVARDRVFDDLLRHVGAGSPVAVFVGSRWSPRHVVLALGAEGQDCLLCYDPAPGRVRRIGRHAFNSARLPLGHWTSPWCTVGPDSSPD